MKNKVAMVTGAGRGIGRATALALARAGAQVVLVSRTPNELDAVAQEVLVAGGVAWALTADIASESEVSRVFELVRGKWGPVRILVNNAAILISAPLVDYSSQDWDAMMAVNVRGMFQCSRQVLRDCRDMKVTASIVNVASLSGIRGPAKFPGFGAYTVSKFAVVGLTEALAVEGKPFGVRTNCIAPGAVDTQMLRKAAPQLKTSTTPEMIAKSILHLADEDQSAHLNGALLEVFSNLP